MKNSHDSSPAGISMDNSCKLLPSHSGVPEPPRDCSLNYRQPRLLSCTPGPKFTKMQWALTLECKWRAMMCKVFYKGCRNKSDSWGILNYNKKLLGSLSVLKLPLSSLPKIYFILQIKQNPILALQNPIIGYVRLHNSLPSSFSPLHLYTFSRCISCCRKKRH